MNGGGWTLDRLKKPALGAAVLGLLASGLGWGLGQSQQFYLSYLAAYLFWAGLPLGALAILMLHRLTGGAWGDAARGPLESSARALPWMALLFLPILFGIEELYVWATDAHARGEGVSPLRARWLTAGSFTLRAALYFAIWLGLAFLITSRRGAEEGRDPPPPPRRHPLLSSVGLALYGLTATFAAVDWAMSLSPEWYSTIYGALFIMGQALGALALSIAALGVAGRQEPWRSRLTDTHFHDLGNLLLAFLMLWAYLAFSQFLIIWSADIAEEVPHYIYRTAGGWKWLAFGIIVLHFFVPFLVLLSRRAKRRRERLALVALGILLLRPVDLYWVVVPGYAQGRHVSPPPGLEVVHWLDLAAWLGLGGVFIAVFIRQLERRPPGEAVEARAHG